MNIYIHTGPGHYIGSVVVVGCESITHAELIIRQYLDDSGLPNEQLNIKEYNMENFNGILYAANGDY